MPRPALLLTFAFLAACTHGVRVDDLVATLDPDIGQVVHVSWTTDVPTRGHLAFGTDESYGTTTPIEDAASMSHTATMVGLLPLTEYHFAALSEVDADTVDTGDDATITTGGLAAEIPDVTLVNPLTSPDLEPLLLTSTNSFSRNHSTVFVLDAEGRVVWSWVPDSGVASVRPMADGRGVYLVEGIAENGAATTLTIVDFDGHVRRIPCADCHHDALELGDGWYAVLRVRFEDVNGETVAGDQLIEINADGDVNVIWDAFDALPVVENDQWDLGQYPDAADWTHANGIAYDPDQDLYLASLYGPREVVAIQRSTGATAWVLGGIDQTITLPDGQGFGPQHAPEFAPGGLRLFDNADLSAGSRLCAYTVDPVARTAERVWSYQTPEHDYTPVLGDVHRFDDGGSLSAWGITGRILAVASDGTPDGDLDVDADSIGQVFTLPALRP